MLYTMGGSGVLMSVTLTLEPSLGQTTSSLALNARFRQTSTMDATTSHAKNAAMNGAGFALETTDARVVISEARFSFALAPSSVIPTLPVRY